MFTNSEATLEKHEQAIYGTNDSLGLLARVRGVEQDVREIMLLRRWMIAGLLGLAADIILRLLFR